MDTTTTAREPRSNLLDDYLSEQQLAVELKRNPRTLQRWRKLGVGPPVSMVGEMPFYQVDAARAWLAAGGTAALANNKSKPRKQSRKYIR
jgi:hypothetical protein